MSQEIEASALTQGFIKSCGRKEVESLDIGERGPVLGRHWMIINKDGLFMLSDEFPKMVWIEPEVIGNTLVLKGRGEEKQVEVPIRDTDQRVTVTMFEGKKYEAVDDGDQAANWVADYLGVDGCRLVHMPQDYVRRDSRGLARFEFADSWAMTLGSDASLEELNKYIAENGRDGVGRERFGHDIWISGALPYDEDKWAEIEINDLGLTVVKPVVRCARVMVRREAASLEQLLKKDPEPLTSLNRTRKVVEDLGNGKKRNTTIFGQKIAHHWDGNIKTIHVGDKVNVLVYKAL